MIKKIKLLLLSFLFFSGIAVIFIDTSLAADQTVICDLGGCSGLTSPLFDEGNVAPGDSATKSIQVDNQRSETLDITLTAEKKAGTDADFIKKVDVTVDEVGGSNKFTGSLEEFLANTTSVALGSIPDSGKKEYEITLTLQDVGNPFQGKAAKFDVSINVSGEPDVTTTDGGDDGGTTSSSAPTCGASQPTSAPTLIATSTSPNTALLTWTAVSPVTHYMIRYGITSGVYIYGASNVGNTTNYTVGGLSGGTTFYFQVAGVNDCAPGPWSNESASLPGGAVLGITSTPGFDVLGAATSTFALEDDIKGLSQRIPVTQGEVIAKEICETSFAWWLPLVIQLIFTIVYVAIQKGKAITKKSLITLLVLGIFSQISHIIIGCPCKVTQICQWYWAINLTIILSSILVLFLFEKNNLKKKYVNK